MALMQLGYVLTSTVLDTTRSRDDRIVCCTEVALLLTICNTRGKSFYPTKAEALRREDSTPHLDSIIELIMLAGA